MLVLIGVVIFNYEAVHSQYEGGCDHCNNSWTQDTMTVEIPDFPGCKVQVTFEKCLQGGQSYSFRWLYMDFLTDSCQAFKDSLFPHGVMGQPNDIFMRQQWVEITHELQDEFLRRKIYTMSPMERSIYWCTRNPLQPTLIGYSSIYGYCSKQCIGYYYKLPGGGGNLTSTILPPFGSLDPNEFIRVSYVSCDENACCYLYTKYCIDPNTGQPVLISRDTHVSISQSCDENNPTQCIFLNLNLLNYGLIIKASDCTLTCPWNED